jgi:hypothetical protein
MAWEALNNIGDGGREVIVVLNDALGQIWIDEVRVARGDITFTLPALLR